jgi:hypothetical protein
MHSRQADSYCGDYVVIRTTFRSLAFVGLMSSLAPDSLIASVADAQRSLTEPERASVAIDIGALLQHWVHSSEEERSGDFVQVFRPAASMNFPPSRFKMAYKFAPGGDCEFYYLSPDDEHHFRVCKWNVGASDKTILRIIGNGKTASFKIVELSRTILRLRPLE